MKIKEGESVTVNGKQYQVTACDGAYRRCRICQDHNTCLPCVDPDPTREAEWSQMKCASSIPNNCYLKPCTT